MAAVKNVTVTTTQILSLAYCTIFGSVPRSESFPLLGRYYGQYTGESCIDYAHFDGRYEMPFDEDNDWFECVTEDGSEGCWIRVDLMHHEPLGDNHFSDKITRKRVGTIKTLSSGRGAWRDMGALAGELTYTANYDAAYKVIKRAKQLAAAQDNA